MRTEDFHKLLDEPKQIEAYLVDDLKAMAAKYPYSQLVQLMYGLRLRTSSEHLFNQQLGKTAALTNDRAVLFELFENKPRSLNVGIETVEVEQKVPSPILAQVSTVPEPKEAEVESKLEEAKKEEASKAEAKETEANKAESSKADLNKVEAEAADSEAKSDIPSEEIKSEEKALELKPPTPSPKVELPSATPENLADLSPQERVQAILKRNRELRAEFDAKKKGEGEKLWSESKTTEPEEENTSIAESNAEEIVESKTPVETPQDTDFVEEPVTLNEDSPQEENEEHSSADENLEAESAIENQIEIPEQPEETIDREAILAKIKGANWEEETNSTDEADESDEAEESNQIDSADNAEDTGAEKTAEAEEREPWADSPIDIEALIRRRFARRYQEPEDISDEPDPWSEPEEPIIDGENEGSEIEEDSLEVSEASETNVDIEQSSISEEETESEERTTSAEAEEPNTETTETVNDDAMEESAQQEEQAQSLNAESGEETENPDQIDHQAAAANSDLALAARIRMIRDRLESLKGNDAISREELEILMEEHRQLEDLMADLPLDEDQLFEVDLEEQYDEESGDDLVQSRESEIEHSQADSEILEEASEDDNSKEDLEELAAESSSEPVNEEETNEAEEAEEADERVDANEVNELVGTEDSGPEEIETSKLEDQGSKQSEDADEEDEDVSDLEESPVLHLSPEAQESQEDSTAETEENKDSEATNESEPVESEAEEAESGEEDLDSEIARIEALAAQLRSGRNREMSQDEINSIREKRMNEMIEARKQDLEKIEASRDLDSQEKQEEAKEEEIESVVSESEKAVSDEVKELDQSEQGSQEIEEAKSEAASSNEDTESLATEEQVSEEIEPADTTGESGESSEAEEADEAEEAAKSDESNAIEESQPVEEVQVEEPEVAEEAISEPETSEESAESDSKEDNAPELGARSEAELGEEDSVEEEDSAEESKSDSASSTTPSFSEWLKKVSGGGSPSSQESKAEVADNSQSDESPKEEISKKIDLLDSFVEKLPDLKKQSRAEKDKPKEQAPKIEREESQGSGLVTETLAKVYIRQKHYKKAIQAYEILMLKYPEKSSFFASQISEIKKLANSK